MALRAWCAASAARWQGAHRAMRLSRSLLAGSWSMWWTVRTKRRSGQGWPGVQHFFPQCSHVQSASCLTWRAIWSQLGGHLYQSIGIVAFNVGWLPSAGCGLCRGHGGLWSAGSECGCPTAPTRASPCSHHRSDTTHLDMSTFLLLRCHNSGNIRHRRRLPSYAVFLRSLLPPVPSTNLERIP